MPLERTYSLINQYGSGLIKSVGLFMPGRYGYALAATTAALDSYKPGAQSSESRAAESKDGLYQGRESKDGLYQGRESKDGEKAGNYQTGPSLLEQTVDVGLGVTKAVGLKASFACAISHNWGMASSAVGPGVASRVSKVALTRSA